MNPMMGIVSDYTAATAPGPIAITPEIYPMSMQHHHLDQQQQTMLEGYHLVHDEDDNDVDHENVGQQHGSSSVKDEDDDDNSNSMQQYDDDGNTEDIAEYHTHFDSDPENSAQSYLVQKTISTQTNKKIKPVKRPGLVLKTPIAYRPCLDPSVIPIQRDGMGRFLFYFIFCLIPLRICFLFIIDFLFKFFVSIFSRRCFYFGVNVCECFNPLLLGQLLIS